LCGDSMEFSDLTWDLKTIHYWLFIAIF